MMDMIKAMALVGSLGVASAAAPAAAPAGVRPMTVVRDLRRGIRDMQLTQEQKTEIRGVLKSHAGEFRQAAERLREARQALNAAVRQEPIDEALIRERAAGAAVAAGDLAVVGAHVRAEVIDLLTDEQRRAPRAAAEGRGRPAAEGPRAGGRAARDRVTRGPFSSGPLYLRLTAVVLGAVVCGVVVLVLHALALARTTTPLRLDALRLLSDDLAPRIARHEVPSLPAPYAHAIVGADGTVVSGEAPPPWLGWRTLGYGERCNRFGNGCFAVRPLPGGSKLVFYVRPRLLPGPFTVALLGSVLALIGISALAGLLLLRTMREADASRRRLVAALAHDLGTPLTSIRGFAETLLATPGEADRRSLRPAPRAAHAVSSRTCRPLPAGGRPPRPRAASFDPREAVRSAADRAAGPREAPAMIFLRPPPSPPPTGTGEQVPPTSWTTLSPRQARRGWRCETARPSSSRSRTRGRAVRGGAPPSSSPSRGDGAKGSGLGRGGVDRGPPRRATRHPSRRAAASRSSCRHEPRILVVDDDGIAERDGEPGCEGMAVRALPDAESALRAIARRSRRRSS